MASPPEERIVMKHSRRQLVRLVAGGAAMSALSRLAVAQDYPSRPVRWLLGYTSGGTTDIISRLVTQVLAERLGQPFVIEPRPGAGTNLATEAVVRAAPDGYTLLFVGAPNAINASLYAKLNFNFVRDIAPVIGIARVPMVLIVHPSVPVKTIPELLAYAKSAPNKLNMASSGIGTTPHLAGELFKMMAGVDIQHIPYRGAAPAMTDLLAVSPSRRPTVWRCFPGCPRSGSLFKTTRRARGTGLALPGRRPRPSWRRSTGRSTPCWPTPR
jgi:tripartite-type tricarboxylate transporter receptor subunit TctC